MKCENDTAGMLDELQPVGPLSSVRARLANLLTWMHTRSVPWDKWTDSICKSTCIMLASRQNAANRSEDAENGDSLTLARRDSGLHVLEAHRVRHDVHLRRVVLVVERVE